MALSLLDLPITIMQDIARFLCPHCHPQQRERDDFASPCRIRCWHRQNRNATFPDLKGLASLCRVNKALRALATPYLYHQPPFGVLANPRAMSSLHRTIASRRPELAKCIKSVHLGVDLPRGRAFDVQGGSMFRYTDLPAFFAGICPNIEELCVRCSMDHNLPNEAPTSPPLSFPPAGSLPRLCSLDVRPHTDSSLDISRLVPLLTVAPNLTSISVWELEDEEEEMAAAAAVTHADLPVMASVRELALVDCELKVELLDVLLRRCPGLERLTLRDTAFNSEEPWRSDGWRTTPRALGDTIVRAAPGLRFLELRVTRGSWPGRLPSDRALPREARFRSLQGLERLEELRIDFDSMLPAVPDYWEEDEDEDEDEAGEEGGDGGEDGDGGDGDGSDGEADPAAELTNLLPPSIRLLHWEGLTLPSPLGLGAFGKSCKTRYPSLKVIFLDYPAAWLRVALPGRCYKAGVREAMAGTGVEVRFRD